MFSSIRIRLTSWHVGVLMVILAAFGAVVYLMMAHSLYEGLDSHLDNSAAVMVSSLAHEIQEHRSEEQGEAMFRTVLATVHHATFRDCAIAVFQGTRLVARKATADGRDPLPVAPRRGLTPRTAAFWSSAGWRFIATAARIPQANEEYTVLIAESDAATAQELSHLRGAILVGIPLSLLLAAIGGWWMARKSLAPVMAMSEAVERISASNLDQRVHATNPQDELGRLGATFNRLLDRLEQAFQQQRQFMADAAHELRTPVAIACTASQLAVERPREQADYEDLLRTIEGQMRRLGRLVEDMFLLSRADAGALPLRPELLYLDELVSEVVRDMGLLARKTGIRLTVAGLTEAPFRGDDALLRRLLLVLLDNALKHTPPGGEVAVEFEVVERACLLRVRDTGPGVPPQDVPRLFERFYRAAKSRESPGAGLGLAIGRTIAEAHGGSLELLSTGASGSVFQITLPASPAPAETVLERPPEWA